MLNATFWVVAVLVAALCVRLAVVDWKTSRLPNRMVGELFALVVVLFGVEVVMERSAGCRLWGSGGVCADSSSPGLLLSMALVSLGLAVPLLVLNLVSPASLGLGDVKLAFVLSGVLGVRALDLRPLQIGFSTLVLGLLLGALGGFAFRRSEGVAPLGPGLILAAWIVFLGLMALR